jgi:GNAT superfamily N-acetyltransferase
MTWTLTADVAEFLADDGAGRYLRADPAERTVELAAAQTVVARGPAAYGADPPLFGWWRPEPAGPVTAAAFHAPPFPLLLSGAAEAAAPLAAELAARGRGLAGVNAEPGLARAFAVDWRERTGADSAIARRSRLFALGELADPRPVPPGAARLAVPAEAGLLDRWAHDFAVEAGEMTVDEHGRPVGHDVAGRLSYGGLTVWAADGTPVSMACTSRPASGVVRVGPVYTPPGQRGRGYGGAVTAAVSRAALAAGATRVVLFTDLANPVSNALYPRLGYRPLSDRLILAFSPAG